MLCVSLVASLTFHGNNLKLYQMLAIKLSYDPDIIMAQKMLIQNDLDHPNILRDNVLCYISGFIVYSMLTKIKCAHCTAELLLDVDDPHSLQQSTYPMFARFTVFKHRWV